MRMTERTMGRLTMLVALLVCAVAALPAFALNFNEVVTPQNESKQPFSVKVRVSGSGELCIFDVTFGPHQKTNALPKMGQLLVMHRDGATKLKTLLFARVEPQILVERGICTYQFRLDTSLCGDGAGLWVWYTIEESGSLIYTIALKQYLLKTDEEGKTAE
jgi:hypothetical protein